jgi:hypothetical protein
MEVKILITLQITMKTTIILVINPIVFPQAIITLNLIIKLIIVKMTLELMLRWMIIKRRIYLIEIIKLTNTVSIKITKFKL